MGISSSENRAPFIQADTCRNEMDWEELRTGGDSLRSSDDPDDREGMSTGDELVGTGYSKEYRPPGVECKGPS